MSRALLTLAAAVLLAALATSPALAEPPSPGEEVPSSATGGLAARYDQAVLEVLLVRREMADLQSRLREEEQRLRAVDLELQVASEQEARATGDLELVQGRLDKRARDTYVNGGTDWLAVLFGSADLGEFLNRLDLLGRVLADEERLLSAVDRRRQEAAQASTRLSAMREERRRAWESLSAGKAEMEQVQRAKEALAALLGRDLARAEQAAQDAEAKMKELNRRAAAPARGEAAAPTRGEDPTPTAGHPPRTDQAGETPVREAPPAEAQEGGPSERGDGGPSGRQMRVKATAYSLQGTTATGVSVRRGIVAVDPRVIPLGTRLYVPGYGEGVAADTGGVVKGAFIDVWLPEPEATNWGVKYLTITILG